MKLSAQRRRGLSWIEVAFVLGTLALLAAVFLPWLAKSRARPKGVSCINNLKQIGLAARIYASDHNDQFPFATAGDRNITGGTLSNGFLRILQTNSAAGWTPALHTNVGNVALSDGSAMRTTSTTLQQQLSKQTLPVIRLAIP
jgi:hypothetical protein